MILIGGVLSRYGAQGGPISGVRQKPHNEERF